MQFEWDEAKRQATLVKHGLDFVDAVAIFDDDWLLIDARSTGEIRSIAIGLLDGRLIAVVFTWRGQRLRLITARRARTNERRAYHARYPGRGA